MSTPSADTLAKVSTEAASSFVETYYRALESSRATLSSYYIAPTTMLGTKPLPTILFNGNILPDGASVQETFEHQMPQARYEVQSYDCQIINPNLGAPTQSNPSGKDISILLLVSGYVRFGPSRDEPTRGFSETFVLVPNPDNATTKGRGRVGKEWLIQSQNFRLVV